MTRPAIINIDLSKINEENEIVGHIIDNIGFSDLYSKTWKGLCEHFFYDPESKLPQLIVFSGTKNIEEKFPTALEKLKDCIAKQTGSDSSLMVVFQA